MAGYKKNMAQYENLEGWEKLSLGMQLDKWAIRYGNRIAVTDSEEEITYSELNQKAIGTGQYFMEKGIQKGDKVLVQLPNRISFVVVLFALAKIGAVPIMMLPAHRETELEGIIALAKPSAYIVAERYLGFYYVEMAMAMQKKFPCIQNVFVDGTQRGAWYEAETERQGVFPEVDSYSTAVLLLSGGTTGVPKLIPRTHTDYMYNARMSAKRCQLDESSVYLAALPVAHNFPLCCPGLLGTFDIGGKVVLAPTTSPDDILTAITEEKVTITALVPAMVTVCMEMLEYDEDYDISSLKILQVGGAMLEDSLADKIIEEWPCTLMQVFGTAERLRHEPEAWTVEIHTVEVYVGTDGDHQDEFLRGNRPKDLLRNSIVTPSLLASILNVKYVNSSALHRIEQEFQRNGVNISRQTMSNWIVRCSQMYFTPFVERMKQELLSLHVTQSDETPTQVIKDSSHPNSKCYMWVHRSGEFYQERPVVIYEYQKDRDHQKPLEFYRDYKGILVTDGLQQYHLVDKKLPDVTNANCWAHARRDFADAVKAMDKKDPSAGHSSVAYTALQKIGGFYTADTELKKLSSE